LNSRRFPPPLSVDELEACFVAKDAGGQKLGYFYYEDESDRRSAAKATDLVEKGIKCDDLNGV